ncbi:hypothetical protein F5141DRAFT_1060264 [Pisolithus sp. B1]|nr:hypothetical protein F5141DRAFT_1060264 [Pisolithus sp. B1]
MSPVLLSFSVQWRTMMWGCCFYQDPILSMCHTARSHHLLLMQYTEAGQALPAPVHLSQVSWRSAETASKQVSPPTVPNRKKRWHPPSNKSARTLCMHHYQKQVSSSLEEFNSYFKVLSGEAKVKYKDEAKELSYVLAAGWFVWQEGTGARSGEQEQAAGSRQ